jgi:hypothetical protein
MGLTGFAGKGTIYMAPVDAAGVKTGNFRKVGNAFPFSVQANTSQKKQISRMHDTAGQVLHVKNALEDVVGTLVLKQWNARNLAYALSGAAVQMTGAGSTIVAENVTALEAEEFAELAKPNVSAVIVKDVTDTTTYVLNTDYVLDTELGLLSIVAGGAITKDDVLHVGYTYAAESGYQVDIATNTLIRVAIKGNIQNEYDASGKWQVELYSAVLASNAEISFISDADSEGEEIPFTLTLETPSGKTTPGVVNGVPM